MKHAGASEDHLALSSNNILELFPICAIKSSLGQRCKAFFPNTQPKSFLDVCCDQQPLITKTENAVAIEVIDPNQNWFYHFEIENLGTDLYSVQFEDKGLFGATYHTVVNYITHIKNGKLHIIDKTLIFKN